MLDIELYRAILGLPIPWTVLGVDLGVKGRQVTVQVHTGEGPFHFSERDDLIELALHFRSFHPKNRAIQVDVLAPGQLGMKACPHDDRRQRRADRRRTTGER